LLKVHVYFEKFFSYVQDKPLIKSIGRLPGLFTSLREQSMIRFYQAVEKRRLKP